MEIVAGKELLILRLVILDLAESVDVYNTWVATIVLTGLAADEPVVFYNCAFIDSEATIEAKNALDDLTFTDCLFEIATTNFRDYVGGGLSSCKGFCFEGCRI